MNSSNLLLLCVIVLICWIPSGSASPGGSITGWAWVDREQDCFFTADQHPGDAYLGDGDEPLQFWSVQLRDDNGVVDTATIGRNNQFHFSRVPAGKYTLEVTYGDLRPDITKYPNAGQHTMCDAYQDTRFLVFYDRRGVVEITVQHSRNTMVYFPLDPCAVLSATVQECFIPNDPGDCVCGGYTDDVENDQPLANRRHHCFHDFSGGCCQDARFCECAVCPGFFDRDRTEGPYYLEPVPTPVCNAVQTYGVYGVRTLSWNPTDDPTRDASFACENCCVYSGGSFAHCGTQTAYECCHRVPLLTASCSFDVLTRHQEYTHIYDSELCEFDQDTGYPYDGDHSVYSVNACPCACRNFDFSCPACP